MEDDLDSLLNIDGAKADMGGLPGYVIWPYNNSSSVFICDPSTWC